MYERLGMLRFATLRGVCYLLVALLFPALPVAVAASDAQASGAVDSASPEAVVQKAADDLLSLIAASQDYANEDPERFYREVEALLSPVVDFPRFARSVMAAHYKSATPDQRKKFAHTFKWGLVRTYALALTEFDDGQVRVIPSDRPQKNPKRRNVRMEIRLGSGEVYPVLYSMGLGKDGAWRMRNIIINGVNIGLTYRSQFASAAADGRYGGDLDKVIEAWADVIAEEAPEGV